jgi:hypothetical protein
MRNLDPYLPAEYQLRADEILVPAGRIGNIDLFSAFNDEDFCASKEEKLRVRQKNRKNKIIIRSGT